MFDLDGSGNRQQIGWIAQGSGLLVYDPKGDTTLNNGTQLFGNSSKLPDGSYAVDGFQALAALDKDHSGHINGNNPEYANLRVWVGSPSGSGSALPAGKMMTLKELGIVDISLNKAETWENTGGTGIGSNVETSYATVTWADGHTTRIGDINLANDPFYQQLKPLAPLSDAALALPEMAGSGAVYDTRQAAQKSPAFADLLKQFSGLGTRSAQVAMLPQLLQSWSDSSDFKGLMARNEWGGFSTNYVYVFDGVNMFDHADPKSPPQLSQRELWSDDYKKMAAMVGMLEVFNGQALYDPQQTGLLWGHAGIHMQTNNGAAVGGSGSALETGTYGIAVSADQVANLQQSYLAFEQSVYQGLLMQTRLKPYLDTITVHSDAQAGTRFDCGGLDKLLDSHYAADPVNAALDMVELAGYGNDVLSAIQYDFAAKLSQWALQMTKTGQWQSVAGQLQDGMDSLFTGSGLALGKPGARGSIMLAPDGMLTATDNAGKTIVVAGSGNDIMFGYDGNTTFYAGAGKDTMDNQGGSATYIGGSGFDVMGNARWDSLATQGYTTDANGKRVGSTYIAGTGGAAMYGTLGNNTYQLALGSGSDTIYGAGYDRPGQWLNGMDAASNSVIQFGQGISLKDVQVETNGVDLILHYSGKDAVTLSGWFNAALYPVQTLQFADGSSYKLPDLLNTLPNVANHAVNGVAYGVGLNQHLMSDGGNDTLHGGAGEVTLTGGAGNDVMYGGTGKNTFQGGAGNATMLGGVGAQSNTFIGGSGRDTMDSQGGSATYIGGSGFDVMGNASWAGAATKGYTVDAGGNRVGSTYIAGTGGAAMYGTLGNNTYQLALGSGSDTIYGAGYDRPGLWLDGMSAASNSVIKFGQGVSLKDVQVETNGVDLILHYSGKDAVTLSGWFNAALYPVQTLQFADGSSYKLPDLLGTLPNIGNHMVNGTVYGIGLHQQLQADDGNDTLRSGAGDATLTGGAGTDLMYGGPGNNQFIAGSGPVSMYGGVGNNTFQGGAGTAYMLGAAAGHNTFIGGSGKVTMEALGGSATYIGGSGFDIMGNASWDSGATHGYTVDASGNRVGSTYIAGTGGGIMYGTLGNNTYQLALGSGSDTIYGAGYDHPGLWLDGMTGSSNSVIKFGPGISFNDLKAETNGSNLILHYSAKDSVTLGGWVNAALYPVQTLQFADGSSYKLPDLADKLPKYVNNQPQTAGSGDETLTGGSGDNTLRGGAGNDVMLGGIGAHSNTFIGGSGRDTMDSRGGSATYIGGSGFDVMGNASWSSGATQGYTVDASGTRVGSTYVAGTGGAAMYGTLGNNTYQLALGSGSDTIYGAGYDRPGLWLDGMSAASNSVIKFGQGVSLKDVQVETNGVDLILHYSGKDAVTLSGWFNAALYPVQTLQFADGSSYKLPDLLGTLPNIGNHMVNGTVYGIGLHQQLQADDGNDTLRSGAGDATLTGGAGTDLMYGGPGNNQFIAGSGPVSMYGGVGNNTFQGGAGTAYMLGAAAGHNTFIGGSGKVTMEALGGSATYIGGSGFDIMGNASWDSGATHGYTVDASGNRVGSTYIAGTGGGIMYGTLGNNTYQLALGSGSDTIYGAGYDHPGLWLDGMTGSSNSVIKFGPGISFSDLKAETNGSNLILHYSAKDSVTLGGWVNAALYPVQTLQFADGSSYKLPDMADKLPKYVNNLQLTAGNGDETLTGGSGDNTLRGGAGNDVMLGGIGAHSNTFIGGSGRDTMDSRGGSATYIGGSGFDVMGNASWSGGATQGYTTDASGNRVGSTYIAGTGGAVMYGTLGNDTYQLALGSGSDTIYGAGHDAPGQWLNGMNASANSVLKFGAGIAIGDLKLETNGADLILHYSDKDAVTLGGWFTSTLYPAQTVQFADGSSYKLPDLLTTLPNVGNHVANGVAYGIGLHQQLKADDGNDTLRSGVGDATLTGGAGTDLMYGGPGNNQFVAGSGPVSMYGGVGNNTFQGGAGTAYMLGAAAGHNTFIGGSGNATMEVLGGSATYIGGGGFDVMGNASWSSGATQGYTVDASGNRVGSTYIAGTGGGIMYGTLGNNTYQLALGSGSDTIYGAGHDAPGQWLSGMNASANSVLKFGAGIAQTDLRAEASGTDLILHYSAKDSVTLGGWFNAALYPVQTVQFADGSSVKLPDWLNSTTIQIDPVNGVFSGKGANELMKSDGQNDTMTGGAGNNTYEISANAAHVLIDNAASGTGHSAVVQFDGATSGQLWFQRSGNDLLVSQVGSSAQVDVAGWYANGAAHVQSFHAADGKQLSDTQVEALVSAMSAFAPPAAGAAALSQDVQNKLQPVLSANWH
ncbi:beta strand repeat-containing protein [Chromobacterium vaccinii]|uniref:beta strand repeat-containing protein n=1 Tax=Chromobacterium vaccinii TaxID=1108595 RepID=UPI003C78623C